MKKKLADEIGKAYIRLHCSHSKNKGDLISRQAVLDEIEKWDWQDLYLPIHFKQILDDIPSVENKGFEGKTNGGVIISLYPDLKYTIQNGRVVTTIGVASSFDLEWWNAPYKAESEGKE